MEKGLKHLNAFWKNWRDYYLLSLRERSQVKLKESNILYPYSAKIGDVILIRDNLPRGSWRMGRIHELISSKDGQIKSAKVLLPSNKIIGRPLNLMYPIECPVEDTKTSSNDINSDRQILNGNGAEEVQTSKPKRQAANKAMKRITQQLRKT